MLKDSLKSATDGHKQSGSNTPTYRTTDSYNSLTDKMRKDNCCNSRKVVSAAIPQNAVLPYNTNAMSMPGNTAVIPTTKTAAATAANAMPVNSASTTAGRRQLPPAPLNTNT